ncbi:variant erythrocyte surface antigen-1 family protein [Babesia caballi]|uniref:Variant erythrocyte surface antigen-1 family protein n=1 Tax=Babesia caballi TaxID=5871 RepID=A0AAV4LNJ5_BABCB|nr:variant erythrocyte surface antigen-1 family protein [Babesia caballi]
MTKPGKKKSLTETPTNLKEAIDWVIKIKDETGAIKGLAEELIKLLDKDGSTLASEVNGIFSKARSGLQTAEQTTAREAFMLKSYLKNITSYGRPLGVDEIGHLKVALEKDVESPGQQSGGPISELADGLKKFIGYQDSGGMPDGSKGIGSQNYESSYYSVSESWNSLTTDQHRDCALILLGIMPVLYFGLSYLYWWCSPDSGSTPSNISWSQQSISTDNGLKKYLEALGFTDNLSNQKTGGKIVSEIMNSMFSGELQTAYTAANSNPPQNSIHNYAKFLDKLQGEAPNPGGSHHGLPDLTEQVRQLLEEVKGVDTGLSREQLKQVMSALADSSNNGLIGKLAEGLQQFIGYDKSGKLTGGGILPANVAKYQVCNAVLNFVIRFLEGLCGITLDRDTKKDGVKTVIVTLRKCVGTGQVPEGFGTLVGKIGEKVEAKSGFKGGVGQSLKTMFEKLKEIVNNHESGAGVDSLQNYLSQVFKSPGTEKSRDFQNLCDELRKLFGDGTLTSGMSNANKHLELNSLNRHITPVTTQAKKLTPSSFSNTPVAQALAAGVQSGALAFIAELQTITYTSYYYDPTSRQWSDNKDVGNDQCAQIFLGCLPLYYQALTYIYWGCHDNGGGWGNLTLANGALKSYFDSQGLLPLYVDKNKRGAHIADSALKGFSELQQGMSEATPPSPFTYARFIKALQEKVSTQSSCSDCPLSALFYGASCYFRYQQTATAKSAGGTPKTIREMLYFLAALQFSTSYGEIDGYIGTLLNQDLNVADSGLSTNGNTLSAERLKEYLRASCAFSSSVLGLIQGPSASQTDTDPWLYELFCNSAFQFKYPSGDSLFSTVSNYAYALQFQLLFLYSMCGNVGVKCGWQDCTYGKEIKGSGTSSLTSHICPGFKCQDSRCKHNGQGINCNHNNYRQSGGCGKSASTPSPLQAFLTGALPSFGLSSSSTPNHMSDHPQGALCHVPMGFQANHLRSIGNGAVVYSVLKPICGNFSSPIRQLCEKLGCLTKRTPRTLGDMFGFTWHLKGQLFKQSNQGNITSAGWFSELQDKLPFSYQLKNDSGENLKKFVGSDHSAHQTSPADLTSLHSSGCDKRSENCGPYLSPLALSNGATFGKPPAYASTYLSWMVYLTDDLETGFQELLHEFKNIDCKASGCRGKAGSQQACTSHAPGTHGTSNECKCDSVVHCGGVLPLLYRYGFTFGSTGDLFGEGTNGTNTKRTCKAFANQLQSVITGKPLQDLFESIDSFLFVFRYYFLGNLSGFWIIYMWLILYTFFFLLDTLHLRSHLKLTSSHVVPPIGLLTSGKPLPVTKLTYIGQ